MSFELRLCEYENLVRAKQLYCMHLVDGNKDFNWVFLSMWLVPLEGHVASHDTEEQSKAQSSALDQLDACCP